jgi:hypothetical protein
MKKTNRNSDRTVKMKDRQKMLKLERLPKLNRKSAQERAKLLQSRVEKGFYKGEAESIAKRWASWYRSYAKRAA